MAQPKGVFGSPHIVCDGEPSSAPIVCRNWKRGWPGRPSDVRLGIRSRLCVFCGSFDGQTARVRRDRGRLGRLLAERGIGLVHGGGKHRPHGAGADACLQAGGEVTGVIPEALMKKEVGHLGDASRSGRLDAHAQGAWLNCPMVFTALPGGFGTFEGLCEA